MTTGMTRARSKRYIRRFPNRTGKYFYINPNYEVEVVTR